MSVIKIKKRDGKIVEFDKNKVVHAIFKAAQAVGGSDKAEAERVADIVVKYLEEKFTGEQVPSVEDIQDLVEKALIEAGHATTAKAFILYRHRKGVEREMKKIMGVRDDLKLSLNSIQVLERRYLAKDEKGKVIETPGQLFRRVARHIASAEKGFGADDETTSGYEDAFYEIMTRFEFLPNSPTLMNAGTELGQLSACFVIGVTDNIEQIFEAVKYTAIIHKSGGGCIKKGSRIFSTFCGSENIERLYDYFENDNNVMLENDAQYIDISNENLRVPSFDKTSGRMVFKPVHKIWRYILPSEKTFAITCEGNYTAETSEWHPFFVFENGEIKEKRADELNAGDKIIISNPSIKEDWPYKENWIVEGIELDEDMAWLTGLFSTDGSLDETQQGLRIRFFSAEQEIIDKALDIIEKKTGIRYATSIDTRSKHPVTRITVYNKGFIAAIKTLNRDLVGRKEIAVRVPSQIFKSPLSVIGAYLGGVMDGDGYVADKKKQVEITGASKEFCEDLSSLFYLFGIKSRHRIRKDKRNDKWLELHEIAISDRISLRRFSELVLPYFALTRKKQRLLAHLEGTHSSLPTGISFADIEPFLIEACIETKNTEIWRKSIKIGKKSFFLARWKEKGKTSLVKVETLIQTLLEMNLSENSKERLTVLLNTLPNLIVVKSVTRNQGNAESEFYDFTVADTNNYLAGNMGLSVIHNTGFAFSYLRPKGDFVKSTAGVASGPISFMSAFDKATEVIKQGGRRRGANMGVLHIWHPDIEEFVTAKQTPGVLENFNVSVGVDDKFMKAVEEDGDYELINPRTNKPVRTIKAKGLFKLIAYSAWKSAEPGILFMDAINRANPTPKFEIRATNPCGEVPAPDFESCNLGSINLSKFVEVDWSRTPWRKKINWQRLRYVIRLATQFLDNVIELNKYPIEKIKEMTQHHRRLGLGVMGFAKMLTKMGIRYDSEDGYAISEEIMRFITEEARKMSHEMGRARGSFPGFKDSTWAAKYDAMRNATVTSIAPTGTISMIGDTSSGIEPLFALAYIKTVMDGTKLYYSDDVFEQVLKVRGLYEPELIQKVIDSGTIQAIEDIPKEIRNVFVIAYDLKTEAHVKMQAVFQKYTDLAVSKTINMPSEATVEDIENAYMMAWKTGCKGVTVYRDKSRGEQVLTIGPGKPKEEKSENSQ